MRRISMSWPIRTSRIHLHRRGNGRPGRMDRGGAIPPEGTPASGKLRRFVQRMKTETRAEDITARVTVTATELFLECASQERFLTPSSIRWRQPSGIRSTFGVKSSSRPYGRSRRRSCPGRTADGGGGRRRGSSVAEGLSQTVYLEVGGSRVSRSGGETPRHVAKTPAGRDRVAALINEMERCDFGLLRSGVAAFDYNVLRAHVGLC